MEQKEINKNCPVSTTLKLIGGKYKGSYYMAFNWSVRFNELKLIPEATPKMLTQQLRELEADKLIRRTRLSYYMKLNIFFPAGKKFVSYLGIYVCLGSGEWRKKDCVHTVQWWAEKQVKFKMFTVICPNYKKIERWAKLTIIPHRHNNYRDACLDKCYVQDTHSIEHY